MIHDIGLTGSLISTEISTERNSFLPSNKSCKSPLVMWKHIHSEQNVLLCAWGHISPRINCGKLGRLPGISIVMNQGLWLLHPESGRESGQARVPAAVTAQKAHCQPLGCTGMCGAPAVPSFWVPADSGISLTGVFFLFSLILSI